MGPAPSYLPSPASLDSEWKEHAPHITRGTAVSQSGVQLQLSAAAILNLV